MLRRSRPKPAIAVGIAFVVIALAGANVSGPQTDRPRAREHADSSPAIPEVWKSKTTGKEYRIRIEKGRLYAEWVNVPPESLQHGAYIRTECRRLGSKWVGQSRSYLPCVADEPKKGHVSNWCRVTTRTEIDKITPDQIEGRTESLRRFDCEACKVLETVMKDFVWVPKR